MIRRQIERLNIIRKNRGFKRAVFLLSLLFFGWKLASNYPEISNAMESFRVFQRFEAVEPTLRPMGFSLSNTKTVSAPSNILFSFLDGSRFADILKNSVNPGSLQAISPDRFSLDKSEFSIQDRGHRIEFMRVRNEKSLHEDVFGWGWSHNYNISIAIEENGDIARIAGDGGIRMFYKSTTETYVSGPGVPSILVKRPNGEFDELVTEGNRPIIYNFSSSGRLQNIRDLSGNTISFSYNADVLSNITTPSNRVITFTYSPSNKITKIVDPAGREYVHSYTTAGDLSKYTDPLGYETLYEYDPRHHITKVTDAGGNFIRYSYTGDSILSDVIDPLGFVIHFGGTTCAGCTDVKKFTVTDANNNSWKFGRNKFNQVIELSDTLGNTFRLLYDADRNPIAIINPRGDTTKMVYDNAKNLTKIIDPTNASWSFQYNSFNQIVGATTQTGDTRTFEYDAKGNLTKEVDEEGGVTTYGYDAFGNRVSKTDPNGKVWNFGYDNQGNLTSVTDPLGYITTYEYDAAGNLIKKTDALGSVQEYAYDLLNRLTQTTDENGGVIKQIWNYAVIQAKIDQTGNTVAYSFDARNELVSVTDPTGQTTRYTYDGNGNMSGVVNARGDTTSYIYDVANRLSQVKYPTVKNLTPTERYTYDSNLNLVSFVNANSDTITWEYDKNNRLTKITYPNGATVQQVYDSAGRMTSRSDTIGTTLFEYDKKSRLKKVTYPDNKSLTYTYDAANNLTEMKDYDNVATNYTYNSVNFPLSVKRSGKGVDYTYDALGRRGTSVYTNGAKVDISYNNRSKIVDVLNRTSTDSVISRFTYSYDAVGSRMSLEEENGDSILWTYNARYELTREVKKNSALDTLFDFTYSYDAFGNRILKANGITGETNSYAYDADNRMTSSDTKVFAYDLEGNMVSAFNGSDTTTYEYDYENRLTKITYPNQSVNTFRYYADGKRYERVDGSGTTRYVWDGWNPHSEFDGSGNLKVKYIVGLGLDEMVAQTRNNSDYFYLTDALGSITELVDANQSVTNKYRYDAWGNIKSQTENVMNEYKFTARQLDVESQFYYFRSRYYDPQTGRFLTKDIFQGDLSDPLSLNRYIYTQNNPVNYVDRTGQTWLWIPFVLGYLIVIYLLICYLIYDPSKPGHILGYLCWWK